MRFTVQYIPLSKIKPSSSPIMNAHVRKLRNMMWDCMHLLVVSKNHKDGDYTIVTGQERYDFLHKHTKKLVAPCLVDESKPKGQLESLLQQYRGLWQPKPSSVRRSFRLTPTTWSIVRAFLKEEPAFKQLTRLQQIQVLVLAVRYKRTVIASMKSKVHQISSR
jgi:hypothetical protein